MSRSADSTSPALSVTTAPGPSWWPLERPDDVLRARGIPPFDSADGPRRGVRPSSNGQRPSYGQVLTERTSAAAILFNHVYFREPSSYLPSHRQGKRHRTFQPGVLREKDADTAGRSGCYRRRQQRHIPLEGERSQACQSKQKRQRRPPQLLASPARIRSHESARVSRSSKVCVR
jgi:hypothetical protein